MSFELPKSVSQIMTTDVVCVEETDHLSNLLESMQALRFRHLPVTDDGRLLGLLTERDLLRLSTSNLLPHRAQQDRALFARFRVCDVMVRDVVTVSPETPAAVAGKLLLDKRLGCLPVVTATNELVGIVTSADFVRAMTKASPTP
ncbi:MAG TPA: CBS domain-containing protein [Polyangiaceae bacterium]|nr:CBS domain-containing protein [Polyangiaceae bacterium]